jgi:hypothetical protein
VNPSLADPVAETRARRLLGYVSSRKYRRAEAVTHLKLGFAAARLTGSMLSVARILNTRGTAEIEIRQYEAGIGPYLQARDLMHAMGYARSECVHVANVAWAYLRSRNFKEASEWAALGLN